MKKSILIFSAILGTLSLAAFTYVNWSNPSTTSEVAACSGTAENDEATIEVIKETRSDLYYAVRNRWSTMTKAELNNATAIDDITIELKDGQIRNGYKNVRIAVLHNEKDVRDIKTCAIGQSKTLTTEQLELLQSSDYSTNLRITALSQLYDPGNASWQEDSLIRYMTIVPEIEAQYEGGFKALIAYLKENSREETAVIEKDKLRPAKVFFTVTKTGTITDAALKEKSGYPSVDEKLLKIITQMPQKWTPATNADGENVDQEYVFFFGFEGC